ncbi:hypothetical protein GF359_01435 [candidate division WOR-3 bacterium]|uniref:Uncharacterized protein n=1 Tax=candidate division WOR-3 bacterium TaxID=2052148 RepID=A0A9D5K7P5_UNCW3|nr:hypothetical protein [candidate division WOR-3 bacterium]MBD3363858.1 hypothetical protein [candidate division WOR-3 bacterium]
MSEKNHLEEFVQERGSDLTPRLASKFKDSLDKSLTHEEITMELLAEINDIFNDRLKELFSATEGN